MKSLFAFALLFISAPSFAAMNVNQLCHEIGQAGLCTRADFCAEVSTPSCAPRDPNNSFQAGYCPQLSPESCKNNDFQCFESPGVIRCVPSNR